MSLIKIYERIQTQKPPFNPTACFKGGSSTSYAQSPEQQQIYSLISPVIERLASPYSSMPGQSTGYWDFGEPVVETQTTRWGNWREYPEQSKTEKVITYPDKKWVATDTPTASSLYDIPQLPSVSADSLLPTSNWFTNLSPEVKAGLWNPYNEAADQMLEQMGLTGSAGSARGGYSGAAGAAMGKLYSDAANDVGLQAWNMISPLQQAAWSENVNREGTQWEAQLQQNMLPYTILPGLLGGTYSTPIVDYNSSNPLSGAVSGVTSGAGLAMMGDAGLAGLTSPTGLGLMAGLGALGFLGGK